MFEDPPPAFHKMARNKVGSIAARIWDPIVFVFALECYSRCL